MKLVVVALLMIAVNAGPAGAGDPLSSLRFLVGAWNCTYQAGKTHVYYKATYAYDMGNNWLRESDAWKGGGSDLGMVTYEPKAHRWTAVILENQRGTTIFRAAGDNPNRIVYRSVYPNAALTDIFERISATHYLLHFTQRAGTRSMKSTDTCVKA